MKVVNDFILTQGGALIKTANFDEEGNRLFFHEDNEELSSDEIIEWLNIIMNDEENIEDEMLSVEMYQLIHAGYKLGFITNKTPKNW